MNFVKLALVPSVQRSAQGKSHTVYNFNPWSLVEEGDVADFLGYEVKQGCGCNGTQKVMPLFAKEADILSGKVVPVWAGQYGAPPAKNGSGGGK